LRNNVSIGSNYNIWIHSNDGIEQKSNDVKYDGRLYIGDNVRIGEFVKVDCYSKITIEKDCLLASHITIMDSQHGMNPETKRSYVFQSSKAAPIVIHEGVWIGENVHILSGSNIGKKSIIGAGAVVKGTIPPYTIAAGVPAKVIKKWNFDEKVWERV
jgi:lipopolysaccharide O-acetyltransferase